MSQKYHVKPDGTVGVCKAERGRCPYQSAPHFNSEQEAQGYINEQSEKEHGILPEVKSEKKTEKAEKTEDPRISRLKEEAKGMLVQVGNIQMEILETEKKIERHKKIIEDTEGYEKGISDDVPKDHKMIESFKERKDKALEIIEKEEERLSELKNREEFANQAVATQAQRINNYKQGIFFDSSLYNNEEDSFYIEEDVRYFLEEYTNKPRGEVRAYALLARRESPRYGWRAGAQGYKRINSDKIEDVVMHTIGHGEDSLYLRDNDGVLELVTTDHDGYNVCEVKPITKSRVEEYDRTTSYYGVNDVISFLEKVPSVKIKKSQRFNTED